MPTSLKILSLMLLTSLLLACGAPTVAPPVWTTAELEQVITNWRVQADIPGLVVGISLAGQPDILIASGEADIEQHTALQVNAQFHIASISKTFIAAEVLRLAERGKIKLDDVVNRYLPETPYGDVVTIRHLLNHRSGYFDPVFDDPEFIPAAINHLNKQWSTSEILDLTFKHALFFEPGTKYRYSNTNYFLLGLVIEKVTQQALGKVLTTDLLEPLHLQHTVYRTLATDIAQTKLVHGYDQLYLSTQEAVDLLQVPNTAFLSLSNNNLIADAADLLKWSRALYSDSSTVLSPAFKEQMLTFDEVSAYGLGVYRSQTPIGLSFGHDGQTVGFLSLMEYFPKQSMSIVILANKNAADITLEKLRDQLVAALYKNDSENTIAQWIVDLKSENASVRKEAIVALGQSGTETDEAITGLIAVLQNDPSAENRKEAALALGMVGKNSPQTKPALTAALQDANAAVREAVQMALSVLK